jgi:hypothetical protein
LFLIDCFVIPKLHHRSLRIGGLFPIIKTAHLANLVKVARPDNRVVDSPAVVIDAVHSQFDKELSRATLTDLPLQPWEHPDNGELVRHPPLGDPTLTLANVISREAFDNTVHSL